MNETLSRIEQALLDNNLKAARNALSALGTKPKEVSRGQQLFGDLLRRNRDYQAALTAYDASIEASRGRNLASIYGKLECLAHLVQLDAFRHTAAEFVENPRFNENFFSRIALAAVKLEDVETAKSILDRIEVDAADSYEARTWFRVAKTRLMMGDQAAARACATKARACRNPPP